MNDDRLRELLRALPATPPGPAFTARTLAGVERAALRRPRLQVPSWVRAAAALVLVVCSLWGLAVGRHALRAQQRRADLRLESAQLARDLAVLRQQAAEPVPVLYLGGDDRVDVVLDLAALPVAAVVPASAAAGSRHR